MKMSMKFAMILASTVMLYSSLPFLNISAAVETDTVVKFEDMILLNDKGMLNISGKDTQYQVYMQYCTDYSLSNVTDPATGDMKTEQVEYDSYRLYKVVPQNNILRFTLCSDKPEAEQQMLEILDRYYPEISTTYPQRKLNEAASLSSCFYILNDGSSTGPHTYELVDLTDYSGSPERADSIMHDLEGANLLSEFYTWGQTFYYNEFSGLLGYNESDFDKEKVENWLTVNHPTCTVDVQMHQITGGTGTLTWYTYAVIPDEKMTFADQFLLAADIYEATGIRPAFTFWDSTETAFGQNALAVAGDVNISSDVDVSDAVMLARFCTEDTEITLTDLGKANADVNGDGSITPDDVTAILRIIAKLN